MTEREHAIDKARKFRALARDQDGKPEGKTARDLFDRVVEKWSIAESELLAAEIHIESYTRLGPEPWRTMLLTVLATWFDCHATHNLQTGTSRLYGDKAGIAATQDADAYVTEWLTKRCKRWKDVYAERFFGFGWGIPEDADFYMTATVSIHRRLQKLKNATSEPKPEQANPLARVSDRETAIDVDRSHLRDEAQRRASSRPAAAPIEHEFVPAGDHAGHDLPWPPPSPEERAAAAATAATAQKRGPPQLGEEPPDDSGAPTQRGRRRPSLR